MALESATYVDGLNPANPSGADRLIQGDDHLRLIKNVLQNTFPALTGPVTLTQDEINSAPGQVPAGIIVVWYGDSSAIPSGWGLCDGSSYDLADGSGTITSPNIQDRAVIGAGTYLDQGETGGEIQPTFTTAAAGSHTHTISGGDHTHTGTAAGHALTEAELPAHKHFIASNASKSGTSLTATSYVATEKTDAGDSNYRLVQASTAPNVGPTASTGSGLVHTHGLSIDSSAHAHTASTEGDHTHTVVVTTLQPSIGLHFIMKL